MSPLLQGAINGDVVILDGIHRLESDTLAVLHSLLTHREIDLADGRRLLRHDRFDSANTRHSESSHALQDAKLLLMPFVHPAFRVIALATPPTRNGNGEEDWINRSIDNVSLRSVAKAFKESMIRILENIVGGPRLTTRCESKLLHVAQQLEAIHDVNTSVDLNEFAWNNNDNSLSIRQLKRIWQSSKGLSDFEIGPLIQRNLLTKFMPRMHQDAISTILVENGFYLMKTPIQLRSQHFKSAIAIMKL